MKIQAALLTFSALMMGFSEGASLRNGSTDKSRNLQLGAGQINSVIGAFVPVLNNVIGTSLGALDTLNPLAQTIEIPEVDFGLCTASASVSYAIGAVTGLDTFKIDTWELVPGTELWESSFFGPTKWGGTWVFNASFDEIKSSTNAGIQAEACGQGIDETIGGSITAVNPGLTFRMSIVGESPNLLFLGWSFADSINVEQADITYDSLTLDIGGFGQTISFDIDQFLQDTFATNLSENVAPAIQEAMQSTLGGGLNFS